MQKEPPADRGCYTYFSPIATRWMDNDIYGHINNVAYYSYFDSVVNRYTIEVGGLDIHDGDVIGLVIESMCQYHQPAAFPDALEAGVRVSKLGRSSVRYEIGIFFPGSETPIASGHFVHVFVDRESRKPVAIPDGIRAGMAKLTDDSNRKQS
ncbi:acyl-CoA thioesterase [Alcaligenaceae bacterium CGII-47]|nr:acyl-CoA thioesterase [Alcaligenaceae bacterium CGII-47]